ncbi:MAG: sulfotransferase family protein [Actinomycetota bacterium]|nr:sulfotransferase family protein [Actinomycetota bacterium]
MIVSHQHRFVFMKTLKTAGTSVEIELSRVCGPDDIITPLPDEDEALRRKRGGRSGQNHESPPLSARVHEHIRASKVRPIIGREVWDSYFKFAIERNPWDAVVSLFYWMRRNGKVDTFERFLRMPNIEQLATRNYQAYHLNGRVAVDRVLRFERLGDDLAEVWRHLSLPGEPDLPHAKSGARPSGSDYRELYDADSAELVRRVFARQVEELGYEF